MEVVVKDENVENYTPRDWNIKIVRLIQKHPVLYNNTLENYGVKVDTKIAWDEVAAAIGITANECIEKWRMLRGSFTRYMKTTIESDGQNKPYYLAKYMDYLLPFLPKFYKAAIMETVSKTTKKEIRLGNFLKKSKKKAGLSRSKNRSTTDPTTLQIEKCESNPDENIEEIDIKVETALPPSSNLNNNEHTSVSEIYTEPLLNPDMSIKLTDESNVINITQENQIKNKIKKRKLKRKRKQTSAGEKAFIEFVQSKQNKQINDCDSDMTFFKSILQDVAALSKEKKYLFRIAVMQSLSELQSK